MWRLTSAMSAAFGYAGSKTEDDDLMSIETFHPRAGRDRQPREDFHQASATG
jgi:hypothetical protein